MASLLLGTSSEGGLRNVQNPRIYDLERVQMAMDVPQMRENAKKRRTIG